MLGSVLDGKGTDMPSFRRKISEQQARDLVARVRAFAANTGKRRAEQQRAAASPRRFEEEFRRLRAEMADLKRQLRELSDGSAGGKRPEPSEPSQKATSSKSSVRVTAVAPAARQLFRQHCVRCHGADGTGSKLRRRQPQIPDFTDPAWQARRADPQLLSSIREGKGKGMPPWRGKVSAEQARGLVRYVRAFGPATGRAGQEEHQRPTAAEPEEYQEPIPAEPADAGQPGCFLGKMRRWLGRFHPAAVHFPIALLTAAAVAEVLRLATRRPAFDGVSRYCVWFGGLTAIVAGVLGWFLAGFRLADGSWVLAAHRWLGTSTVACAGLALVLTEVSRRPGHPRTRTALRSTLLAVAALALVTGFFGGAVVFGLGHYDWPP